MATEIHKQVIVSENEKQDDGHSSQSSRADLGNVLTEAREQKQWSIEKVAGQLKLSKIYINQLESGVYDPSLSTVYIKGYLRNYFQVLGLSFDHYQTLIQEALTIKEKGAVREKREVTAPHRRAGFPSKLLWVAKALYRYLERFPQQMSCKGRSFMYLVLAGLIITLGAIGFVLLPKFINTVPVTGGSKRPIVMRTLQRDTQLPGLVEPRVGLENGYHNDMMLF